MTQFNLTLYRDLLTQLKGLYKFTHMHEALNPQAKSTSQGNCILRHDIDYSLDHALKMAQLENQLGVQTTYYVLLDSIWYNLLGKNESNKLKKILELGHKIGLHFHAENLLKSDWQKELQWQKSILEKVSGQVVESFSYHCPEVVGLAALDRSDVICDMANCYASSMEEIFPYRSDSLGRFRDETLIISLKAGQFQTLHLLIHPIWWQEKPNSLDKIIQDNINSCSHKLAVEWRDIKKSYNIR